MALARWPGIHQSRNGEKTAAASVMALANNLPANAADMVKAVHGRNVVEDRQPVKPLRRVWAN